MREFKIEDIMPVKAIEQQVWRMFDILRGNSIGSNDYHIILLFLSLYKDDQISKEFQFGDDHLKLEKDYFLSDRSPIKTKNDYSKIIESFSSSLLNIRNRGFKDIIDALFQIDRAILKEHFSEIFDFTLNHITQSRGRSGGDFILPIEITRFICGIAEMPKKARVFNPFAGLASFGIFLNQGQDYFGQEINKETWAIGALRILAYESPGAYHYDWNDSILHWPKEDEKFDLVIANPPYGVRLTQQYREVEPNIRTLEQFLIQKGVNSLTTNGKLIALLPQGFLFRGMQEQRLREHLIEEDLIDTIIALPGGLLLNTGIPLVVLVINKEKNCPGKVRFIDAKKFVESKSPKEKVLNDYKLNSVVHRSYNDSEVVRLIDVRQIREFDYNLNVPRYFQKHIEGVKLKDIVEFVIGSRKDIPDEGKMIRTRDLKDDNLDYKLDISQVEKTEFRRAHLRLIDESCLLLATRWKTLKPTFFEFSDEAILLNSDILSFKINEKLADTAYLINELHADYVAEQLASYRQGATIPMITRDDLLEIKIKLPSLSEQEKVVQTRKIELINKAKKELGDYQRELGVDVADANSFLRHQIAGPLKNLRGAVKSIKTILNDQVLDKHPEILDLKVSPKRTKTFGEYLDMLSRDFEKVSRLVKDSNKKFEVESAVLSDVDILKLVRNYVIELKERESDIDIDLWLDEENLSNEGVKGVIINGNEELIILALDNLVENAIKHGLNGYDGKKGLHLQLLFSHDSGEVQLDVSNTGNPVEENFDINLYIREGGKVGINAGDGVGGSYVSRIMKKHNGRIEYTDEQGSEGVFGDLVTTFEMYYPIKDLIKDE